MSDSEDETKVEETVNVEEETEIITTLESDEVLTKYQEAAKIANLALEEVIKQCQEGTSVISLCKSGDELITNKTVKMYNKKVKGVVIEKGIAFPTCISVNECVCHNSPLESETEKSPVLQQGDMVKIDMGVHIDGYIAVVAHTVIVGADFTPEAPLTDKLAKVFECANICGEITHKLIRPGNTNTQITEAINKVAKAYDMNLCAGTLMHQTKRYVIDGNKTILLRDDIDTKVDDVTFEMYETYAIDICVSSGEGKPREQDARTTVFKRAIDKSYRLKMKASRYVLGEVNRRYPTLPFTLRAIEDERQAKMGIVECLKHDLVHPYQVLYERTGDLVVHLKFTVLICPNGTVKVTGLPQLPTTTDVELDDELKAILALSSKNKKKKKKKKASA